MKFFTPTDEFTHYGLLEGIPCYFRDPYGDCIAAGTNVVWDWLTLILPPILVWLRSFFNPFDEPGFMIRIDGELR
jgi:hypothetical protein